MATTTTLEEADPTTVDVALRPPATRSHRVGIAVLLGTLVLIGVAVTRPIGNVLADRTEHSRRDISFGPLLPERPTIVQPFIARDANLASISLAVGTFGDRLTCTVRVSVTDDTGATVGQADHGCGSFRDNRSNEVVTFDPPIAQSEGRAFELQVTLLDGPAGPVIWGTKDSTTLEPARLGADVLRGPTELTTSYHRDGRAWSLLGTALDRIGRYGPFWNNPAFVVIDVLAIVAALAGLAFAPRRTAGVLLIALALSRGLLWAAIMPPFAGPDEGSHFAYAQILSERHVPLKRETEDGLPAFSNELVAAIRTLHAGGPNLDRPDYDPEGERLAQEALSQPSDRLGSQNSPVAGYSPAYYLVPAVLDKLPGTIDQRLGAMRLWSVALGAATVWLAYRIGRRLFPDHQGAAVLLGVAVAFQPMLAQQTAVLNNDAAVIAGGVLCLLVALQLADRRPPPGWPAGGRRGRVRIPTLPAVCWAGVAVGLTLLAKPTGLVWLPVLAVAWLIGRRRREDGPAWWREALAGAAGLAATFGAWMLFATLGGYPGQGYSGDAQAGPKGLGAFTDAISRQDFKLLRTNWLDELWGQFSWLTVSLPHWAHVVLALFMGVLAVAGVALVARTVIDLARARRSPEPSRSADPAEADLSVNTGLVLLAVVLTFGGLLFLMWQYFHQMGRFDLIQGRYALMVVPALLALPALFGRRFAPRLSPVVPMSAVAVLMAILHVTAVGVVVNAFYY